MLTDTINCPFKPGDPKEGHICACPGGVSEEQRGAIVIRSVR